MVSQARKRIKRMVRYGRTRGNRGIGHVSYLSMCHYRARAASALALTANFTFSLIPSQTKQPEFYSWSDTASNARLAN